MIRLRINKRSTLCAKYTELPPLSLPLLFSPPLPAVPLCADPLITSPQALFSIIEFVVLVVVVVVVVYRWSYRGRWRRRQ